MLKAYRYQLFPTQEQIEHLSKLFGCCRLVFNEALAYRQHLYKIGKQSVSKNALIKRLPELKEQLSFLKEVYSQCLQQAILHMDAAYQRFFQSGKGFPRFKKKHDRQSASFPQNAKLDFDNKTLRLPKIGDIPLALSRTFEGTIKTVTVCKTATGKYFASVLVEDGKEPPLAPCPDPGSAVGIDVGLKDFATLSTGEKVKNPRKLKTSLCRLRRLSRSLSRKRRESRNRAKARKRLALLHERIADQRKDFLHKQTHHLVVENQATSLCVEDLAVKNLMRNRRLSRSIADASWGEFFRQLAYKCHWYGKNLLPAGRFDASSQTCSECGWRHRTLSLSEREWCCPVCEALHDRDINAARNLIGFAFAKYREDTRESKPVDSLASVSRSSRKRETSGRQVV